MPTGISSQAGSQATKDYFSITNRVFSKRFSFLFLSILSHVTHISPVFWRWAVCATGHGDIGGILNIYCTTESSHVTSCILHLPPPPKIFKFYTRICDLSSSWFYPTSIIYYPPSFLKCSFNLILPYNYVITCCLNVVWSWCTVFFLYFFYNFFFDKIIIQNTIYGTVNKLK